MIRRPSVPRLLAVLLIIGAAACAGGGSSVQEDATFDPALVATGADRYATYCASCHGVELEGTNEGPPFLSEVYEPGHHADIAFLLAAQRGVTGHHWPFGDMEPVEGVTEEDISAIVAFVREGQSRLGLQPYPP